MSCGLGAVILILMLVKYQSEQPDLQSSALQADIAILETQNQQSQQSVETLQNQSDGMRARIKKLNAQLLGIVADINAKKDAQRSLQSQLATLQPQADSSPQAPPAPVPVVNKNVEDYLLGLKVEGRKIVILVDSSASMMEERLIDIIRRKVSSAQERQQSPKWQRTLRIIEWMLVKVPADSDYQLIRFAEKATVVGGGGWKKGGDAKGISATLAEFKKVLPGGGTNLHAAMSLMRKAASGFTNVYLVTDGLPTLGKPRFSSYFSACASIVGQAKKISGKCRLKLLDNIVSSYKERASVNVVLLPLEGDSGAAGAFWRWTIASDGLLISPESSWP